MPRTHRGWFIVEERDADTGNLDCYEIYEPCAYNCERPIMRSDGTIEHPRCECWIQQSEPTAIAHTIKDAHNVINKLNTEYRRTRALEKMLGLD